jgi:hypothetical protein
LCCACTATLHRMTTLPASSPARSPGTGRREADEPLLLGSAKEAARIDVLRQISVSLDLRVGRAQATPFVTGPSGQEQEWKNLHDDVSQNELVDRSIVQASRVLRAEVTVDTAMRQAGKTVVRSRHLSANWQPPWWLEQPKRPITCTRNTRAHPPILNDQHRSMPQPTSPCVHEHTLTRSRVLVSTSRATQSRARRR